LKRLWITSEKILMVPPLLPWLALLASHAPEQP
jgi:hypothetical protein